MDVYAYCQAIATVKDSSQAAEMYRFSLFKPIFQINISS